MFQITLFIRICDIFDYYKKKKSLLSHFNNLYPREMILLYARNIL